MPDNPFFEEELARRIEREVADSLESPEFVLGWVHKMEVADPYVGSPGVGLTVTIASADEEVSSAVIFIPSEGVPILREILRKLNSAELLRQFPGKGTTRSTGPHGGRKHPRGKRRPR